MTRLGVGTLAAGLLLSALGWLADWPAVAAPGLGMVILVVGSVITVGRRPRLEVSRQVEPAHVQKGSTAVTVVYVRNLARHGQPPLHLEQRLGETPVSMYLPRLRRGGEHVGTYRLPTERRGDFQLGALEVVRADPFGLCRRVQRIGDPQLVSIHPRIVELSRPPAGRSPNLEGPSSDMSPQGSVTFHRIREYTPGDDLRRVHWPSTARRGTLMVRHLVDTAQAFSVILLDQHPDAYSAETFETAVDVAASAVIAMSGGSAVSGGTAPVQLCTTSGDRVGGPTGRDPRPLIDRLTGVRPQGQGTLAQQLSLLRGDRGGSVLVVVTGSLRHESLAALVPLRRRFDRVVVVSIVARAELPPQFPGLHILTATSLDQVASSWQTEAVSW